MEGRLDLGQDYTWLELAIFNGKYYVSFPPFPSYILLPFAALFGTATPDHLIAYACAVLGAFYAVRICKTLNCTEAETYLYPLFLYLSSGLLFVCFTGYVWFIAQNLCFTLSLMAIFYALQGKGGRSFTFWACAVGCRPMALFYGPVLLYLLYKGLKKSGTSIFSKWHWAIPTCLIALSYMLLNYFRFGSITEFGHNYLPEFTRVSTGQFSFSYFAGNLKNLLRFPTWETAGESLSFYTANGMVFYLVTPMFLSVFAALCYRIYALQCKNPSCKALSATTKKEQLPLLVYIPTMVLLHILFLCCHKTLGGWHFGNRYLLDTLPWLFLGLLLWKPKNAWFLKCNLPLFFFGFALNFAGMIATYNYWI